MADHLLIPPRPFIVDYSAAAFERATGLPRGFSELGLPSGPGENPPRLGVRSRDRGPPLAPRRRALQNHTKRRG